LELGPKKIFFKAPSGIEYRYVGDRKFEDAYELSVDKWFEASVRSTRKIFHGDRFEGKGSCAICGKSEGVTFKNASHILPACTGNDIFFSAEECDSCNSRMNEKFDLHFGAMTAPARGLFGMPTRRGPAKWKSAGGSALTEFDPRVGNLSIKSAEVGNLSAFKFDEERRRFSIEGPGTTYMPVRAIGALVHSCWLFLDSDRRKKHPYLLQFLNELLVVKEHIYFSGMEPGIHPHLVRFEVYEKKLSDLELPGIIVRLAVGPYFWAWASPDLSNGSYRPFPIFPLTVLDEKSLPTLSVHGVPELDVQINSEKVTFEFFYESNGSKNVEIKKDPPVKKKSLPASLRVSAEGRTVERKGLYLRVLNAGSSNPYFSITGRHLGIELEFPANPKLGFSGSLNYTTKYAGMSSVDVFMTCELLELLGKANSRIEIWTQDNNGRALVTGVAPKGLEVEKMFGIVAKMLMDLESVLKVKFRFPKELSLEEAKLVSEMHQIYFPGNAHEQEGTFSLTFTKDMSAKELEKFQSHPGEASLGNPGGSFKMFGAKVVVPPFERKIHWFSILEPMPLRDLRAGEKLVFKFKGVTYKKKGES
jgi:hypothetical protein